MISFVYGSDFHGDVSKFEAIYDFAVEHNINLIHLGADLLPKGPEILSRQKYFIQHFLKNFYQRCAEQRIKVLAFFGNDDIYTRKKYFRKYADLLDEKPYVIEEYEFKAYPFVQDYKFGLKTACKLDRDGWKCPDQYLGLPCDFNEHGYYKISDIEKYFVEKGTIEEDLRNIHATPKTIMAIHQPPLALGLDVCRDGRRVGSQSVFDWIRQEQPLVALCGHIHESPEVSGIWRVCMGRTTIIQPGQAQNSTTMVLISIEKDKVDSLLITR